MHYASRFGVINREVRRIAHFFETVDIFLTPSLATPPVTLGTLSTQTLTLDQFQQAMAAYCPFTGAFNATGQPAISLPLHWSRAGLPVGVWILVSADASVVRWFICVSVILAVAVMLSGWRYKKPPSLGVTLATAPRMR